MVTQIFCFDIDDTICLTRGTEYDQAIPIKHRIAKINRLFAQGHTIKLHTARGSKTGLDWRQLTEEQLRKWEVNYHELHMGKPYADFYIDDKAIKDSEFDWE